MSAAYAHAHNAVTVTVGWTHLLASMHVTLATLVCGLSSLAFCPRQPRRR